MELKELVINKMSSVMFILLCQSVSILTITVEYHNLVNIYKNMFSYPKRGHNLNEYQTSFDESTLYPHQEPGVLYTVKKSLTNGLRGILYDIHSFLNKNSTVIAMGIWIVAVFGIVAFEDASMSQLVDRKRRSINPQDSFSRKTLDSSDN